VRVERERGSEGREEERESEERESEERESEEREGGSEKRERVREGVRVERVGE
jgi:hypothetical protein